MHGRDAADARGDSAVQQSGPSAVAGSILESVEEMLDACGERVGVREGGGRIGAWREGCLLDVVRLECEVDMVREGRVSCSMSATLHLTGKASRQTVLGAL